MHTVDGPPGDQPKRIGAQLVIAVGIRVENAVKQPAAGRLRADRNDVAALQRRAVRVKDHGRRVAQLGGVKLVHIVTDAGIQARVHGVFQAVVQAHMQNRQRGGLVFAPGAQALHGVIGAGVVHHYQFILGEVAVQLRRHRAAELHRTGPVVMQVDHGGDKVFFLIVDTTHSSSTSSKS